MPWWWPFRRRKKSTDALESQPHDTSHLATEVQALLARLKTPDQHGDMSAYVSQVEHILSLIPHKKHPLLWAALQVALGDGLRLTSSRPIEWDGIPTLTSGLSCFVGY